jgi:hypothetical protein
MGPTKSDGDPHAASYLLVMRYSLHPSLMLPAPHTVAMLGTIRLAIGKLARTRRQHNTAEHGDDQALSVGQRTIQLCSAPGHNANPSSP